MRLPTPSGCMHRSTVPTSIDCQQQCWLSERFAIIASQARLGLYAQGSSESGGSTPPIRQSGALQSDSSPASVRRNQAARAAANEHHRHSTPQTLHSPATTTTNDHDNLQRPAPCDTAIPRATSDAYEPALIPPRTSRSPNKCANDQLQLDTRSASSSASSCLIQGSFSRLIFNGGLHTHHSQRRPVTSSYDTARRLYRDAAI